MKRTPLFLVILAVSLLAIAGNVFVQNHMNRIITDDKLVDAEFSAKGTPPVVAFTTVALGGFRGLIADVLWLRSISLQEQGKYYELVQLADWILKLQPKFAGAAAYLGWNMAYNISVTCQRPEDRWRWIHRGIERLRQAISMSPNDPELYKELGWIYQHKLGNVLDDAQRYYKYEMAKELLFVLGSHYPDWNALADAPLTEKELLHAFSEEERRKIEAELKGKGFLEISAVLDESKIPDSVPDSYLKQLKEDRFAVKLAELGYASPDMILGEFKLLSDLPKKLRDVLSKDQSERLSNYLRAKWMRDVYILDPVVIRDINAKFGDLDWLIPESQAIYWATQGLAHTQGGKDLNCDRMILQSLKVSFSNGRMLLPDDSQASLTFMLVPNLALAPTLRDFWENEIKGTDYEQNRSMQNAYENFLGDTIVTLYSFGNYTLSEEYFNFLRDKVRSSKVHNQKWEDFVVKELQEQLKDAGYKQTHEQISAYLTRAVILLGYGDREASLAHQKLAKRLFDKYQIEYTDDRVKLPPFDEMKRETTRVIMNNFPDIASRIQAEIEAERNAAELNQ